MKPSHDRAQRAVVSAAQDTRTKRGNCYEPRPLD
jgi:hypothetical protein